MRLGMLLLFSVLWTAQGFPAHNGCVGRPGGPPGLVNPSFQPVVFVPVYLASPATGPCGGPGQGGDGGSGGSGGSGSGTGSGGSGGSGSGIGSGGSGTGSGGSGTGSG
ncbi:loricrin-like isoform X1 [Penaeus monodon]|uniref:loricrin-like isoform X1 n=1 Tax=Penaeus monodon TaxID=6687 RepID=UPI0018A7DB6C|nr:loricrin-like isoform X1 [Penaeus monodon]